MNLPVTDHFSVRDAAKLYGLEAWGNGYLDISAAGHLEVRPVAGSPRGIDLHAIVRTLVGRGVGTPMVLRFPQIIESQLGRLTGAFGRAIAEYDYPERFVPVFPVKVNQRRTVVDSLLEAGRQHNLGLEVGSRPELIAATALDLAPGALIICNGFKDAEYLSCASLATRLGKHAVVVIEKPFELDFMLERLSPDAVPGIGLRIRLQARGSGMWEKSGGVASKFGLSPRQLLDVLAQLRRAGLENRIELLHFHIGSQITEIRKLKNAVAEAARVYAKLHRMGVHVRYLDVGGGLGVDYDGSRTSSDASTNYSVQEYANDVVFGIWEICDQEGVPPPTIVSESGRMLTAYHAALIADVRGVIRGVDSRLPELTGEEPQIVQDLTEVWRTMTVKNYREFYHDAIEYRNQMHQLFNLGMLELEARAQGESLFWLIAARSVQHARTAKFMADEFAQLEIQLRDKYMCNFSVFQSLPDHWALDQLFPVMPIHRLNEPPTRRAALVDITCDSDGEVDKFVDMRSLKEALEVHELIPGNPYYLAFLLVGAYQDTMGDMHNMFGRVHEADVVLDASGEAVIREMRPGEPAADVLLCHGFGEEDLVRRIERALQARVDSGNLGPADAATLLEDYRNRLRGYPYLV